MSDVDLFEKAQDAAEEHWAACNQAEFDYDEHGQIGVDSPASAPYCGCDTCVVREILHAAWPILRQAALEGYPE